MPKPVGSGQRYMPGLDGLRAIAVLAVIAFHEQFSWAPGGMLGVGVFFTLSGYLITDLLLNRWHSTGGVQLGKFWLAWRGLGLLPIAAVRDAGRRHRVGHPAGSRPPRQPPRCGRCRRDLLKQLVPHHPGPVVLLAVRATAAARPPVVARGGRAVLSDLALAAPGRPDLPSQPHCRRGALARAAHARARRRLSGRHVRALPSRPRPDQGLRGH